MSSQTQTKPSVAMPIEAHLLHDDGLIPNSRLPLLIYTNAVPRSGHDPAADIERLLATHRWSGSWRSGIYPYHHYHSTAHEVLVVYRGSARIQLGGERGIIKTVSPGDVILIPAGVGHKNLGCDDDFSVVGAYPVGQEWDMCYGQASERPTTDQNIAQVPLPEMDPIYGKDGPLLAHWKP